MPVLLLMVATASLLPLPGPYLAQVEVGQQQDDQGDEEEDRPGLGQGARSRLPVKNAWFNFCLRKRIASFEAQTKLAASTDFPPGE
jgi:hypothetical protein